MQMSDPVSGDFVTLHGERYYVIRNVDGMPPFLVSLVSSSDHWMFVASNGGLTAGRVSPETALFPYVTVDKLYDSTLDTGSRTLVRVEREGASSEWEPFNRQHGDRYRLTRNLYKSVLGDRLLFEEVNQKVLIDRNVDWEPKISEMVEGRDVVLAVGAAHLSGETGVLRALERAGYTIEKF